MKNTRVIIGVLAVMMLALAMPAMAGQQVKIVQGNDIPPMFQFSVVPGDVVMPLLLGTNDVQGNAISAASNTGFTISIKDDMANAKPIGYAGEMGQYKLYQGTPIWAPGLFLSTPMKAGLASGTLIPLTASDQIIKTGSAEAINDHLSFEQVVVPTDPKSLDDSQGYQYTMTVMVTGSAT